MDIIKRFKDLPQRESMRSRNDRYWNRRRYWGCYKIGDYSVWTLVYRVCDSYIGKPFNDAFSYFCTLVPKHLQSIFLDEFDDRHYRYYDVDDDGNIQNVKRKHSKKVYFTSLDYAYDVEYWKDGKVIKPDWWNGNCRDYDEKKIVVTSGYCYEFSSRNDPTFKKLMAEKMQQLKKIHRAWKEVEEEKFWKRQEECIRREKEKEKEENDSNIQRFGFDAKTSFKGDEYHGQKRKKNS